MRLPHEHFRHCPQCGQKRLEPPQRPVLECSECGFTLFFNPALAAGAFLTHPERGLLFLRRAKDPARGKLALPGGFIDYQETAEQGLRREIREEVGLEVGDLEFLCSQVNHYEYRGVTYPVVDIYFTASCPPQAIARALDGVEALCWLQPHQVRLDDLAFPSLRAAMEHYRE